MGATAILPESLVSEPGTKSSETPERRGILPPQEWSDHIVIPILSPKDASSARPAKVMFGALRHPNFRLRQPIPLRTEVEGGIVSVVWDEIQEFGSGETFSEAIFDFTSTVTELFIRLSEKAFPLSDDLLRVKRVLSDYIEPRPR